MNKIWGRFISGLGLKGEDVLAFLILWDLIITRRKWIKFLSQENGRITDNDIYKLTKNKSLVIICGPDKWNQLFTNKTNEVICIWNKNGIEQLKYSRNQMNMKICLKAGKLIQV